MSGCTSHENYADNSTTTTAEDSVFDTVDDGIDYEDDVTSVPADVDETKAMEELIKKIQEELGDSLTQDDLNKIKSLSYEKVKLLYEKHKALISSLEYEFSKSGI